MFHLFEVTARFYSHRPALLHRCNTAGIQDELEKKMLFRVLLFCPCGTNSSPKLRSSKLLLWCVVLLHVCPLARVLNQSHNCGSLQPFNSQWVIGCFDLLFIIIEKLMCYLFDIYSIYTFSCWLPGHHMPVRDLKLIYISLQGWLCSVIYEIELASSLATVVSLPALQQERSFMQPGCLTVSIQFATYPKNALLICLF